MVLALSGIINPSRCLSPSPFCGDFDSSCHVVVCRQPQLISDLVNCLLPQYFSRVMNNKWFKLADAIQLQVMNQANSLIVL